MQTQEGSLQDPSAEEGKKDAPAAPALPPTAATPKTSRTTRRVATQDDDPSLDPVHIVEAALFSSGRPLALDEIAENTHLSRRVTTTALKKLVKIYSERETALEVGQAGDKWAMQLRARYAVAAQRLAPMEIAPKLLKTLALIAYHQPVVQSELIGMVGDKGYEHVRELYERGLIKKRVHERSFLVMTTETFPEYFGIPAADREGIKTFLAEKLGITLPKTDKKGNAKLRTFADSAAPAPAAEAPQGDAAAADEASNEAPEPADAPAETRAAAEDDAGSNPDAVAERPETSD